MQVSKYVQDNSVASLYRPEGVQTGLRMGVVDGVMAVMAPRFGRDLEKHRAHFLMSIGAMLYTELFLMSIGAMLYTELFLMSMQTGIQWEHVLPSSPLKGRSWRRV